jgi:hypothetical protein
LLQQLAALTPAQWAALPPPQRADLRAALDAHERAIALRSHRAFCESPHWCGLTLSPLMAAVMDAAQGRPVTTIDDEASLKHFGCERSKLPRVARRLVAIRAGGRAGKSSRLLATAAIYYALVVPLPTLAARERAVSLIIAPDLVLARQVLGFVGGYCETSPALASMVVRDTADEIELRRPDGQSVLIRVRAASRGGKGGRGFVFVFAGLDEAAFFRDDSSGVVNDTEVYRPVAQRLAPGAQAWIASTPWVEGIGLLEEKLSADFGAHEHTLCAVAPTRALNPTWDPDGTIEAALRESDPDNADREILAIPLAAGSTLFFDKVALDAATDEQRPLDLPAEPGGLYGAAGDFAFRRNASAMAIVRRHPVPSPDGTDLDRYELVFLDERKPEKGTPLKPAAVCDDFGPAIVRYGAGDGAGADSHERDVVAAEMARHNVTVVALPEGQKGKAAQYLFFRRLTREGRWIQPKNPRLRAQQNGIIGKPAPGGGLSISSPTTPDGAHGDLVSAVVGAAWVAQFATGEDAAQARADLAAAAGGNDSASDRYDGFAGR